MKRTPEDQKNWQEALEWACEHASQYGLAGEVEDQYISFTNNKSLTRDGYFHEANCALYEWDI